MSFLTKLFVVLLVICSLLLTAATVVFVNNTTDFRKSLADTGNTLSTTRTQLQAAQNDATAAKTNLNNAVTTLNNTIASRDAELSKLRQDMGGKDTQINDLKAQLAIALANNTTQSQALAAANQNLKDIQARYDGIIKDMDTLRTRNAELNTANTDFEKRLDETERERRFLNEQVIQLRADTGRLRTMLAENHINPDTQAGARRVTAPNLRAKIDSVESRDGQTYATIDAGSNDKVEKGMQFTIVDPQTMDFLGKLTVDSVDPNAAFGRVEGPKVQDVKKGNVVLTQIQ